MVDPRDRLRALRDDILTIEKAVAPLRQNQDIRDMLVQVKTAEQMLVTAIADLPEGPLPDLDDDTTPQQVRDTIRAGLVELSSQLDILEGDISAMKERVLNQTAN